MPLYPLKCTACTNEFDAYASMSQRHTLACPSCGSTACETRFSDLTLRSANREFDLHKRESVQHWFPEGDVAEIRESIGGDAAKCIRDDGTVLFNDREQERQFNKARELASRREVDRAQRAKAQHAEKVRRGDVVEKPDGTMSVDGDGPRRSRRRASKAKA